MNLSLHDRAASFAFAFPDCAKYGGGLHVSPSAQGFDKFFATWTGGADYRNKSSMYGALPPYFLPRVFSIFPDARRVLHLFSGSLTAEQVDEAAKAGSRQDNGHVHGCGSRVSIGPASCCQSWSPLNQIRFDNGLHPAAKVAKPDVIGDAEQLAEALRRSGRLLELAHGAKELGPQVFDLIIADPPYRIPDMRRYWREAMFALPGICTRCKWGALEHEVHYTKSSKAGGLYCPSPTMGMAQLHEIQLAGYVRFKPLDKTKVVKECAKVLRPGGHLVWLDEIWPQHSKTELRTVGHIGLWRSTMHRVRAVTVLARV